MNFSVSSYLIGAIVTGIAWSLLWEPKNPNDGSATLEPAESTSIRPSRSRPDGRDLLINLSAEADAEDRFKSALKLRNVSTVDLEERLDELVDSLENGELGSAVSLLLIEWARRDPGKAIDWAWENLRGSQNWPNAFRQIGPQWAWDDPAGHAEFLIKHRDPRMDVGSFFIRFSFEEIQNFEQITLGNRDLRGGMEWVLKISPRDGFRIFRQFTGSSSRDPELVSALKSTDEVSSALSAWDDYDPQKEEKLRSAYEKNGTFFQGEPEEERLERQNLQADYLRSRHPRDQKMVQMLIERWKALDEESFAKSSYADWEKK
ncbi:hypothetical protein V2O64_14245 [Verrucomicrobiaceae bacterium 227]